VTKKVLNRNRGNAEKRQRNETTEPRRNPRSGQSGQDEIQGVAREYPGPVKVPMGRVRNKEMLGRAITGQCPEDSRDAGPFTPKHEKTKDSLMTVSWNGFHEPEGVCWDNTISRDAHESAHDEEARTHDEVARTLKNIQ